MRLSSVVLVFVCIMLAGKSYAEIKSAEGYDTQSGPPKNTNTFECGYDSKVGVHLSSGQMEFPYGPPGSKVYKGSSRASGFSLRTEKNNCDDDLIDAYVGQLAISNYFPSNGRKFDIQAVSWTDFSLQGGVIFELPRFGYDRILNDVQFVTGLNYERFLYGRGVFSFQYIPFSLGLSTSVRWSFANVPALTGLQFGFMRSGPNRILVDYPSAPTSQSAKASVMSLNGGNHLSGKDYEIVARFGFSSLRNFHSANECCQHEISVLWNSKIRTSKNFMTETFASGAENRNFDLEMKAMTFTIRWSERI